MKFDLLYIDPPWKFITYSNKGMGRSPKYTLLDVNTLKNVPIPDLMNKNCIVFGWVTDPFLEIGLEVYKHWGLTYKTVGFYWIKTTGNGKNYPIGTGYYTRANPEQCLIFTKGKVPFRNDRSVPKLIVAERRKHSQKPPAIYTRIDKLYPTLSKIEIFATQKTEGYTSIGNEIDSLDIFDSIKQLKETLHLKAGYQYEILDY